MKVIKNELMVFFDVDDTLVLWVDDHHMLKPGRVKIINPYDNSTVYLDVHKKHTELIKHYKGRNYTVVVWSAGGYRWANTVIETLGLTDHVDFVMTKPVKYIDDLPSNEWMGQRLYLNNKKENI